MSDRSEPSLPNKLPDLPVGSDPSGGIFPSRSRGCAVGFVVIVILFFGWLALLVNLPANRPSPEPLSEYLEKKFDALPIGANVLVFLNMNTIRQTDFWMTFLPDSIKTRGLVSDSSGLGRFAAAINYNFTNDTDTLIYAAINQPDSVEHVLTILIGKFDSIRTEKILTSYSIETTSIAEAKKVYRLDSENWICQVSGNELVVTNRLALVKQYLFPQESFFAADTVLKPLIDNVRFKSQLWMVFGSTRWAIETLRGLTSASQGLGASGNISKVKQLSLSVLLSDGLFAETIWTYDSRTSAFFAGGLIQIAAWVSRQFSERQSEAIKKILSNVEVTQDLERMIINADVNRSLLNELRKE